MVTRVRGTSDAAGLRSDGTPVHKSAPCEYADLVLVQFAGSQAAWRWEWHRSCSKRQYTLAYGLVGHKVNTAKGYVTSQPVAEALGLLSQYKAFVAL